MSDLLAGFANAPGLTEAGTNTGMQNVLIGQQIGQQNQINSALASVDPSNPSSMQTAINRLVQAGATDRADALSKFQMQRQIRNQAMAGSDPLGIPGGNNQGQGQSQTGAQAANQASGNQAQAQTSAPSQDQIQQATTIHSNMLADAQNLSKIPAGDARVAAATKIANEYVQEHELDPAAAQQFIAQVSGPNSDAALQTFIGSQQQALDKYKQIGQSTSPDTTNQGDSGSSAPASQGGISTPDGPVLPGSGMTEAQARHILTPAVQEKIALYKSAGLDYSALTDEAKHALEPQQVAATARQTYEANNQNMEVRRDFTDTDGTQYKKGQSITGMTGGQIDALNSRNGGNVLGAPSSQEVTGPTSIELQDGSKKTFASARDADDWIQANPDKATTADQITTAIRAHAADMVTIKTGTSEDTMTFPDAVKTLGYAKAMDALNAGRPTAATGSAGVTHGMSTGMQNITTGIENMFNTKMTSGYRTPAQNAAIPGSAQNSLHMAGEAADFRIPPGMTAASFAAQIKQQFPNVNVLPEPNAPAGPHVHVSYTGGNTSGSAAGNNTSANSGTPTRQPGFGHSDSAQNLLKMADTQQYADIKNSFNTPNYDRDAQQKIQDGSVIAGLAPLPLQAAEARGIQFAQSKGIPLQQNANIADVMKALSANAVKNLSGAGIKNQVEYEAASHASGSITDPKESLVYSGALLKAAGEYQQAQKALQQKYDALPTAQHTAQDFAQYQAKNLPDFFTMPAFQGVVIGGKPLVVSGQSKSQGKGYLIGAGLGSQARFVPANN